MARALVLTAALMAAPTACGGSTAPVAGPELAPRERTPRSFAWIDLQGQPVGTETLRGRRTVVAFVATFDLASQLVVQWVATRVRLEVPRIQAVAVVLEPPSHAPLVEAFASTLQLPYPVVIADTETLRGGGPFGDVRNVPTLVVLDAQSREVWRKVGATSQDELRSALAEAQGATSSGVGLAEP